MYTRPVGSIYSTKYINVSTQCTRITVYNITFHITFPVEFIASCQYKER